MSCAEYDGFLTGLNDIRNGRWDIDNVIPPARHINLTKEWLRGYREAFEDTTGN